MEPPLGAALGVLIFSCNEERAPGTARKIERNSVRQQASQLKWSAHSRPIASIASSSCRCSCLAAARCAIHAFDRAPCRRLAVRARAAPSGVRVPVLRTQYTR